MRTTGLKRFALVAALVVPILMIAGCGDIYSRGDFTTKVMNKSEPEVIKEIGKPSNVDNSNPDRVIWTYTGKTFDIENQNTRDAKTMLILEHKGAAGALMVTNVEFG
jgi:hypothetical protein